MKFCSILVCGDVMLDVFHIGSINRISPEAPVPVFDEEDVQYSIGGAGNVAANIKSLLPRCEVDLLHIKNKDLKAEKILDDFYINQLFHPRLRVTNLKHRFIDKRNKQQVGLRWDEFEGKFNRLTQEDFKYVQDKKYDVIVFSDYAKGCLEDFGFVRSIIKKAQAENVRTVLDSKSDNLSRFEGVEIFKPNNKEFEIYQKNKMDKQFKFDFKYVIRTESENGMTLYDNKDHSMLHRESIVQNIVSTVGAGDTALAGIVWALANELSIQKTLMYSNFLAGRACMHPGTYIATQEDLNSAMKFIES
jgi:rfaE bifunctional protein kinase chain/domain